MKKPATFKRKVIKPSRTFNGRSSIDRMYDKTWEEFSKQFLKVNHKCYACGRKSECVDHIEPHLGRIELFWKEENYLPLCHKCHNTITAKFDRYHVVGKPIEKKLVWIDGERRRSGQTSRVKVMNLPGDAWTKLSPIL